MKYLILILLFISCKKETVETKSSERRATGPSVDLQIPRLSTEWKYKDSVGLMAKDPVIKKVIISKYWANVFDRPIGDSVLTVEYDCLIANYGYKDLLIDRSESGLYNSENNEWNFDWLLQLSLSKDGRVIEKNLKQAFFFTSNQLLYDSPPIAIWYAWDTMWLARRSGDLYVNRMPVPHHIVDGVMIPNDGLYELAVTVNFRRTVEESNYRNNTGYLNFKIVNGIISKDWITRRKGRN